MPWLESLPHIYEVCFLLLLLEQDLEEQLIVALIIRDVIELRGNHLLMVCVVDGFGCQDARSDVLERRHVVSLSLHVRVGYLNESLDFATLHVLLF